MVTENLTKTARVMLALHEAGKPTQSITIARRAKVAPRDVNARILPRLFKRGLVCRQRLAGSPYYWYALAPGAFDRWSGGAKGLQVHCVTIPPKLRFLRDLREREPFRGLAVLNEVIQDYERCLREQTADKVEG